MSSPFEKAIPKADPAHPRTVPKDQVSWTLAEARLARRERARARAKTRKDT